MGTRQQEHPAVRIQREVVMRKEQGGRRGGGGRVEEEQDDREGQQHTRSHRGRDQRSAHILRGEDMGFVADLRTGGESKVTHVMNREGNSVTMGTEEEGASFVIKLIKRQETAGKGYIHRTGKEGR